MPTAEEFSEAQEIVGLAQEASQKGDAIATRNGKMLDEPGRVSGIFWSACLLVRHARLSYCVHRHLVYLNAMLDAEHRLLSMERGIKPLGQGYANFSV